MAKEEFKEFVRKNPKLITYVKDGSMTWQKFYELYDMYGEEESVWSKYKNFEPDSSPRKMTDILEKIDPDSIQKHIETAQKALDIFSEFATKTTENITNNIKPSIERPLSKFFCD